MRTPDFISPSSVTERRDSGVNSGLGLWVFLSLDKSQKRNVPLLLIHRNEHGSRIRLDPFIANCINGLHEVVQQIVMSLDKFTLITFRLVRVEVVNECAVFDQIVEQGFKKITVNTPMLIDKERAPEDGVRSFHPFSILQ